VNVCVQHSHTSYLRFTALGFLSLQADDTYRNMINYRENQCIIIRYLSAVCVCVCVCAVFVRIIHIMYIIYYTCALY